MYLTHRSFADTVKSTLLISSSPCPQTQPNPDANHHQNKSKDSIQTRKRETVLAGNSAEDLENCGPDNHVNTQEGLGLVASRGSYDFVSLNDGGDAEKATAIAGESNPARDQWDDLNDINEEKKQNFFNLKQHYDDEYSCSGYNGLLSLDSPTLSALNNSPFSRQISQNPSPTSSLSSYSSALSFGGLSINSINMNSNRQKPLVNHMGSKDLLKQIDLLLTPSSAQGDDSERERDIDRDIDGRVHKRTISVNYQEVARLLPTKDLDFDINDELLALGCLCLTHTYIYIYIV